MTTKSSSDGVNVSANLAGEVEKKGLQQPNYQITGTASYLMKKMFNLDGPTKQSEHKDAFDMWDQGEEWSSVDNCDTESNISEDSFSPAPFFSSEALSFLSRRRNSAFPTSTVKTPEEAVPPANIPRRNSFNIGALLQNRGIEALGAEKSDIPQGLTAKKKNVSYRDLNAFAPSNW